jgi:hypothetical protein
VSGLGGSTKVCQTYLTHLPLPLLSLSSFPLELVEMSSESSLSNRLSGICPSLSEIGVQKNPQEWSRVFFFFNTWQFFSNIHPDMGQNELYSLSDSVMFAWISFWGHFDSKSVFWIFLSWENPQGLWVRMVACRGLSGMGRLLPASSQGSGKEHNCGRENF